MTTKRQRRLSSPATGLPAFIHIQAKKLLVLAGSLVYVAFILQNTHAAGIEGLLARVKDAPCRVEDTAGKTLGAGEIRLDRKWNGNLCAAEITNVGKESLRLGNLILFDLANHGLPPDTGVYGEGFQMLAQTEGTLVNPARRGPYPDATHYRIPEPDGLPTVYGMMTLQSGPEHALLGFTSCRRFIGRVSFNERTLRVSVDPEGLELAPGASWKLEEFIALQGPDRGVLLEKLAARVCVNHPPLPQPAIKDRTGWCTWYGVGGSGNQQIITRHAEQFARALPDLGFMQIDEGYTLEGDLLGVAPEFGDMKATLAAIRRNRFLPGIWVGPFIAAPGSQTLADHPEWFVQGPDGKPLDSGTVGFGGWKNGPWRVFDGTHPETLDYLEHVFKTMRNDWGITYFKLDGTYWGAIHRGKRHDPKATRVEAYRRGMEAVIRGAGRDAIILGCNAPMWPSFGLVNVMRTSNDITRNWDGFSSTGRENLNRTWQNGRLWVCDPDCVQLAGNPAIPANVWQFHATIVHAVGGLVLSGDKIEDLAEPQLAMLRKLIPPTGRSATFPDMRYETGVTDAGDRQYLYAFNWGNDPVTRTLDLKQRSELTDFWTGEKLGVHQGEYRIKDLPGQSARLIVATPPE